MSFVFFQIDFPHLFLRKEGNLKKIVLMKETSKRYHQFIYEIFKTFFFFSFFWVNQYFTSWYNSCVFQISFAWIVLPVASASRVLVGGSLFSAACKSFLGICIRPNSQLVCFSFCPCTCRRISCTLAVSCARACLRKGTKLCY